jgi:predicted RNA binding protein YcfA (HicA-like mRNA interferase family)
MTPRQVRLNAPEVAAILEGHGFKLVSQRGSHQKWRNADTGKQVILPYHQGKDLPIGTLRSIIEGSGIPPDKFIR